MCHNVLWYFQGASMNQRRVDFYLGAVGDCLIAVGGRNDTGALASVEVYNPAKDCWSYVAGLPRYILLYCLYFGKYCLPIL